MWHNASDTRGLFFSIIIFEIKLESIREHSIPFSSWLSLLSARMDFQLFPLPWGQGHSPHGPLGLRGQVQKDWPWQSPITKGGICLFVSNTFSQTAGLAPYPTMPFMVCSRVASPCGVRAFRKGTLKFRITQCPIVLLEKKHLWKCGGLKAWVP